MATASIAYVSLSSGFHDVVRNSLIVSLGCVVELRRSHEHLDKLRFNRPASVDYMESANLSSQEGLRGVHLRTSDYVNAPRSGISSVMLTKQLGSVSPPFVSSSIGTEFDTLTT